MTIAAARAIPHQPARPVVADALDERAARALDDAVRALAAKQRPDGHWCGELEGDSILSSEYLLMKAILGQARPGDAEWGAGDDARRIDKMCVYLRRLQRADGTWGQYPGAQADLSACVKAYLALKIFGDSPRAPHMARAREGILARGGAENINTFSMFYLACLGQVEWDACPAIPPEIVFLPRWFPFHMDKVAAWTRTMILPLALCTALRPIREIPGHVGCAELFVDHSKRRRLNKPWDHAEPMCWQNVFLVIDRALKVAQRAGLMPLRSKAIRAAHDWIVRRMSAETTEGLGAIFPPMVYIQVALQRLGYPREHPVRAEAEKQLDRFIIEEGDHVRIQPCFSPVWDTGIALYAMTEAGLTTSNSAEVRAACDWLLEREVPMVGDWVRNLRPRDQRDFAHLGEHTGAGVRSHRPWAAWAFEYRNDWYPDVDDTAMVAKALRRAASDMTGVGVTPAAIGAAPAHPHDPVWDASQRACRWLLAMQNDDGGWAAFDRTRDRPWMEKVPFADHNAMQDPSCADITGRTLEALITCGVPSDHEAVRAGVAFLRSHQRPEGCWWGRWGVNYVYGTWQAMGGLHAAGVASTDPMVRRALAWLRSVQNADGGFGETADTYVDPALMGRGPSTPSQTAWGVLAMMYAVPARDAAVQRAIRWLCDNQLESDAPPSPLTPHAPLPAGFLDTRDRGADATPALISHPVPEPAGSWREGWFTGTGFPKVFYLRYHLYRHYFPVMALARWTRMADGRRA